MRPSDFIVLTIAISLLTSLCVGSIVILTIKHPGPESAAAIGQILMVAGPSLVGMLAVFQTWKNTGEIKQTQEQQKVTQGAIHDLHEAVNSVNTRSLEIASVAARAEGVASVTTAGVAPIVTPADAPGSPASVMDIAKEFIPGPKPLT
jgi:hypothetical protein